MVYSHRLKKEGENGIAELVKDVAKPIPKDDEILVKVKAANMTYDESAGMPFASVTALQVLRDKGIIEPGQKVLINGGSGGGGTFAVQLAKSFDTEVPEALRYLEKGHARGKVVIKIGSGIR